MRYEWYEFGINDRDLFESFLIDHKIEYVPRPQFGRLWSTVFTVKGTDETHDMLRHWYKVYKKEEETKCQT